MIVQHILSGNLLLFVKLNLGNQIKLHQEIAMLTSIKTFRLVMTINNLITLKGQTPKILEIYGFIL
jgi:hypothetical protein